MEQEVSLIQMLDARERRVWHQQELLGAYGKPLVCFTMNIAGPVKDSPFIRRGFARGRQLLERQFLRCGIKPLKIDLSKAVTGPEAFYVLDAEPLTIKKLTTLVEDASPLGRLFDMDVLRPDGKNGRASRPRPFSQGFLPDCQPVIGRNIAPSPLREADRQDTFRSRSPTHERAHDRPDSRCACQDGSSRPVPCHQALPLASRSEPCRAT